MFVELCKAQSVPLEQTMAGITVVGLEHLKEAMAAHGRVLVLTAHLGNWELMALGHQLTGFPTTVVVRPLDADWLDVMAAQLRQMSGIELVDKRAALRPVLAALNRGRMTQPRRPTPGSPSTRRGRRREPDSRRGSSP